MTLSTTDILNKAQHIHFVGIGGVGISAVAMMFIQQRKQVTGSDRSESELINNLTKAGATIYIGHAADNIPAHCDVVVYTVAIPHDNPELACARERNIPLLTYPQTLHYISEGKYTIAVSGTHGKTTVSAMIASIFIEADLDPTVLVGSMMYNPRSRQGNGVNYIQGESKYFIVEADEYKKSFHNLSPSILVINNLDLDHLDFYKDLADIQASFRVVAGRVPEDGFIICNPHDPHVIPVVEGLKAKVIDYTLYKQNSVLKIPGEHNRFNAAAAAAVAAMVHINSDTTLKALEHFPGTWRRFEYKGTTKAGALIYDDYAHNPKKIQALIQGARELFPDKKIVIVFQPHLYSRTKHLFHEFTQSFGGVDEVVLVPVYAAREEFDPSITSGMLQASLVEKGIQAMAVDGLTQAKEYVESHTTTGDIILIAGAGDITGISDDLVEKQAK